MTLLYVLTVASCTRPKENRRQFNAAIYRLRTNMYSKLWRKKHVRACAFCVCVVHTQKLKNLCFFSFYGNNKMYFVFHKFKTEQFMEQVRAEFYFSLFDSLFFIYLWQIWHFISVGSIAIIMIFQTLTGRLKVANVSREKNMCSLLLYCIRSCLV